MLHGASLQAAMKRLTTCSIIESDDDNILVRCEVLAVVVSELRSSKFIVTPIDKLSYRPATRGCWPGRGKDIDVEAVFAFVQGWRVVQIRRNIVLSKCQL